jgi:hypothetical protein
VAAYALPPSATHSAMIEMTSAGLGVRSFMCFPLRSSAPALLHHHQRAT